MSAPAAPAQKRECGHAAGRVRATAPPGDETAKTASRVAAPIPEVSIRERMIARLVLREGPSVLHARGVLREGS